MFGASAAIGNLEDSSSSFSNDESSSSERKATQLRKKQRFQNYTKHLQLIEDAHQLKKFELEQRLVELKPLSLSQDFPEEKGMNMFQAISTHPGLSDAEKRGHLIFLVFNLGYIDFYSFITRTSLIKLFLADKKDLKTLYLGLLKAEIYPDFNFNIKDRIWDQFLDAENEDEEVLASLRRCPMSLEQYKEFVVYRFGSIKNEMDIVDECKEIENALKHSYRNYYHYIKRFADIRILEIRAGHAHNVLSKFDNDRVKKFLKASHFSFFKCCSAQAPYDVFKQINNKHSGNIDAQLAEFREQAEEKINRKMKRS